ncbi:MAG: SDR family oxidoreductase [Caldilineaceae bacterium]|nr:SDR family oxidoreductase [Caldilineaceae bacterium]
MQLQGKTALVTGGGTGIGRAVAVAFANAGAKVVITGRREVKLQETCALASGPHPVQFYVADVSDREQVAALVAWTRQTLGSIDILVNNAGVNIVERRMEVIAPESWDYLMNVNATGVFNTIHAVLPEMRERRDGLLITVSSISGVRPSVLGGAAYSASKHAVNALIKVISVEEKNNGIRATIIAPGEVNTPILDDRPVPVSDAHKAQILQPEDVAASVLFVATLHPRAHVPELIIKPLTQEFV